MESTGVMRRFSISSSHYFLGEGLVALAGFISFPIFTRVLTVSDYGLMSLVATTLALGTVVGSGGLRPAAVRFFGEFQQGPEPGGLTGFYSTFFFSTAALSLLISMGLGVSSFAVFGQGEARMAHLVRLAAALVFFRCIFALYLSCLRAENRTLKYNSLWVAQHYLSLGASLLFVVALGWGLDGLYSAQLIVEGVFLVVVIREMAKVGGLAVHSFSRTFFWQALIYSLPLAIDNASGVILHYGDRYVLNYFIGKEAVAVYSVGANLVSYFQSLLLTPLQLAVFPLAMALWSSGARKECEDFVRKVVRYYWMAVLPVVAGFSVAAREVLLLLASDKYSSSTMLIPILGGASVLAGATFLTALGIYISKRTWIKALATAGAGLMNLTLNFAMVPFFGVMGAAAVTLLTAAATLVAVQGLSRRYLAVNSLNGSFAKYLSFSLIMAFGVWLLPLSSHGTVTALGIKVVTGVVIYGSLVLLFDEWGRGLWQSAALRLAGVARRD